MSIYETLGFYNIDSVWHFTDESNLDTIEKYGILSLNKIVNQNIKVACFGADSLSHSLFQTPLNCGFKKQKNICQDI
jgi:hypothetical protein